VTALSQPIAFRRYGPYALFLNEIAAGGMATLHLGRRLGDAGFARTVAIKRLRHEVASDPKFVAMFIDEARIAARIRHPNVAATIDVFRHEGELWLVLEYVHGESLRALLRAEVARSGRIPPRIAASIVCGALQGLHAAHEAKSEQGAPLGIVHRDVSLPNILVGADGITRVVDFGIAKAAGRLEKTETGLIKGKFAYMAPEQIDPGRQLDRRTDVFSAGIVFWEMLAGKRLFHDQDEYSIFQNVMSKPVPELRAIAPGVPQKLEQAVRRALEREPDKRFQTAREFARAIEESVGGGPATAPTVGEWVEVLAKERLDMLDQYLRAIEGALPSDEDDARASVRRVSADDIDTTSVKSSWTSQPVTSPVPIDAPSRTSELSSFTAPGTLDTPLSAEAEEDDSETPNIVEPVTTIAVDVTSDEFRSVQAASKKPLLALETQDFVAQDIEPTMTREQVLASVLARPRASPNEAALPPHEPNVPWTGALFGDGSPEVAPLQMNQQWAAAHRSPSLNLVPAERSRPSPRLRGDRRLWVLGVVALVALLLWFAVFFGR
jgi:eukaryotic-like serine/threonine-protein kinase